MKPLLYSFIVVINNYNKVQSYVHHGDTMIILIAQCMCVCLCQRKLGQIHSCKGLMPPAGAYLYCLEKLFPF